MTYIFESPLRMTINLEAITGSSPELLQLHQTIDGCTKCELYKGNEHYVPGMGSQQAEVMFVGEGPGKSEDKYGKPFVGASGKFLDELLVSIGLSRESVYIANMVKCRPPENRDPKESEMEACSGYLDAQIQIIKPKVIVTLGRFSMVKFLPGSKISEAHGVPVQKKSGGPVIFPCYHPAAALYNGSMRPVLMEDFQQLKKILTMFA